ncbi:MAG: STT3 domain-containing protein [Candidatus Hadarchaeales archaeon]
MKLNYRRWLIAGYLIALMVLSFSILTIPGEKYQVLTTSDSGWVYGIAREMEKTNSIPEKNPLSHAPYGWSIGLDETMQPLLAVVIYRGLHVLNPSLTLFDVTKFFAPLMYALTLIPIFLIGRELKGDIAGAAAAFFMATLVSSIYWVKTGAFDREPSVIFFGAWFIFAMIKLFKSDKKSMPGYALLGGLSYGLLLFTWPGSVYLLAVVIGATVLVLVFRYFEKLAKSLSDPLGTLEKTIREHLWFIGGVIGVFLIITAVQWLALGRDPSFWTGFAQTLLGYVGISFGGGGGISLPIYASEAQKVESWNDVFGKMYGNGTLNSIVILMMALGLLMFLWKRKNHELLMLGWIVILLGLTWPGVGQARFERLWWPFVAVVAGAGVAYIVSWIKDLSFDPSWEWLKKLQSPLIIIILTLAFTGPFVLNAYAEARRVSPPTEWRGPGVDAGLMEAFEWIERENIPENAVFAIQWSFGHLFTGATGRPAVCDGVEGTGEEGLWENTATIKPPDYIYRRIDSTGEIYGMSVARKPWAINGRRTDVQWFPKLARDELKWLLKIYRDNYNVKIDYIIFTVDQYWEAKNFYATNEFIGLYLLHRDRQLITPSQLRPTTQDNKLIFNFGGERSAVVLEPGTAYVQKNGQRLLLDGYAMLRVGNDGRISGFGGFVPSSEPPQINEILVIFMDQRNNVLTAWLVKGTFGEVARPMEMVGVKAYEVATGSAIDGDESLVVAFSSSNQYVKVIRVNHDLL